jgi:hypothetical protein
MLVFRKACVRSSSAAIRRDLAARIERCSTLRSREALLSLVIRSGEIESALEDIDHPASSKARSLTDAVANALSNPAAPGGLPGMRALAEQLDLPHELELRRAEGYAYYALDPNDYAKLARTIDVAARRAVVLGIRSIGASLSAVVAAELCARGIAVSRASVRPSGHPWDRRAEWSSHTRAVVEEARDAAFFVVDEGPGLSGSSFLAVGDALKESGVPHASVHFLCSRRPDTARLVAPHAETRWKSFNAHFTEPRPEQEGELDLCAGRWRDLSRTQRDDVPLAWEQRERSKYLSSDRRVLRRFVGYPPYGEPVAERADILALAGFSPAVLDYREGFLSQRWEGGRYFPILGIRPVERIAEYLAFRARSFPTRDTSNELDHMLRANVAEAVGTELPSDARLEVVAPTVCDGSLAPHEWLLSADGRILKTDSADHGDDHLYPGPCDIAWDLAGAVVEWSFDANERERLLNSYRALTGDDASARLATYELAYAAFRVGCMRMAKLSAGPSDIDLLVRAEQRYEDHLRRKLPRARRAYSHGRDLPA